MRQSRAATGATMCHLHRLLVWRLWSVQPALVSTVGRTIPVSQAAACLVTEIHITMEVVHLARAVVGLCGDILRQLQTFLSERRLVSCARRVAESMAIALVFVRPTTIMVVINAWATLTTTAQVTAACLAIRSPMADMLARMTALP